MWLRLFTIFRNYLPVPLIFLLLFLVLIVLYASRFIFVFSYCLTNFTLNHYLQKYLWNGICFFCLFNINFYLERHFLFLTHKAFAKVETTNLIICLLKLSRNFLCSHKIIGRLIALLMYHFSLFCYGRVLGASK